MGLRIEPTSNAHQLGGGIDVASVELTTEHLELDANGEGVREKIVIGQVEQSVSRQRGQPAFERHAIVEPDRAGIRLDPSCRNLEQRGFPGAVPSEQHA